MYSKIDATPFLKKNDHLNASIDRSLVNEYTNKTGKDILLEFLKNSFLISAPFLSFFILEITNIILFTYSDSVENNNKNYQFLQQYISIQCFYYFFGFIFFFGAMKYYESFINYDKREVKLKSIFYNFSRIFYFIASFLYLIPLVFLSYYFFLNFFNTDEIIIFKEFYYQYFIYIPLIFYLTITFHLNMQILKHFNTFYLLIASNFLIYWISLYFFSLILKEKDLNNSNNSNESKSLANKIPLISYSLLTTNLINLILSHFEIKRKVNYLKEISFFYYTDILQLKFESFLTFAKYSSVKGILFNFNYPGVYLIIFSNQILSTSNIGNLKDFTFASFLSFILMALPHLFIWSLAKYYKNYLENSVYDHSQNTKTRYLKFFWLMVISFSLIFSIIILLLKKIIFLFLLNLPLDFFANLPFNENNNLKADNISLRILDIFTMYDYVIKFYSIFIFFDSFGISFQEIIKTFNDHSRYYLNFYKGISLVFVFFPLGIVAANFLQIEIFWGLWIGVYLHMIIFFMIFMVVTYRNYYTSTFQIFY